MVDTCTYFPSVNMFVMMWCLLTWICFLAVDDSLAGHSEISEKDSIIWGPGLKADAVLPARYFFIQAVDKHGNNLTESLGEDAFEVNFQQSDGERVRAAPRILDRHDGSYIVRYRLHWSSKDMTINVKYRGIHVAHSPYLLKGPVFQEKCYCPQEDEQWQETLQCRPSHRQIKLDLQLFRKVDMFKVREEAVRRFNEKGRHSLCHIVVKDNKVYRKTYGEHVGFKMFMDAILLSMARKVRIPDIEFFVNLGDWPLEHRKSNENPLPIFSWCGSEDTRDIIMPTYDVTESTLETMGRCDETSQSLEMPTYEVSEEKLKESCRVTLDLLSVQANTGPTWENKSSSAIWRGRDSRQERLDLVKMSRKHPDIIDAKLTNMFFFKKNEEELGEIVKHISFFDFFKHKYQINIDGTVAAYRFPYLMAGDSLVFKQDSSYYEHFYKSLKPYVHYVPFKRDLSDLMEKLQWARDHDEEARKIAKTGQLFIRENMMAADIFCYHQTLFKEYAKRLTSPVEVLEGMELVEQPTGSETHCDCQTLEKRERKKKEEL